MAMFIVKPWYKQDSAIYGAEWDGTSRTDWTRTDAAASFANPNPYYAGMSGTPSSPFDNVMPWKGMKRVSDASAGELVEIPKFYYKLSQPNGVGLKVQISMKKHSGFSTDPMHMDRGDGVGEREYAYMSRYLCASDDYKSTTNKAPKTYIGANNARIQIHNLGAYIYQFDHAAWFTLALLYLVEYAHWNSQDKIGYGGRASASNNGTTDNMPYHTGTVKSSRTAWGDMQYRYVENLWSRLNIFMDGVYNSSNGMNIILNPNNFSFTSGGISVGTPTSGYPLSFAIKNVNGTYPLFIPNATGGSDSTYTTDYWGFNASANGVYCGGSQNYRFCGMFYRDSTTVNSEGSDVTGCRLMVLPPSRLTA